ncbi:MAG: ATP-binding protein [Rhodospirillales bacterium]|nr:MAG: ATP-binding protein [Rhodospirillales bacterium]
MARGELMKKLLVSYGRDEEFRAVAEQIISEEERKNNRALARSLRKALDSATTNPSAGRTLAPLIPFPDATSNFVERIEPSHDRNDILLSHANIQILTDLIQEFRRGEDIRRHGLTVRSKLLLCGPPGCGKTLCAEIFAAETGLAFFVVKIDRLISSYLGETAANVRKVFEFARAQPCVLFLDEFDALARARDDAGEHNELRRVVNSLLIFIDRIKPKGFLVAATNLDKSLDPAIWRRFDEVIWFDKPDLAMIGRFLRFKFKNAAVGFDVLQHATKMVGYSFAEIERICTQAIKAAVIDRRKDIFEQDFVRAIADEARRRTASARLNNLGGA